MKKTVWTLMVGATATVWTFEGDWSAWDKPQKEEAKVEETRTYGTYSTPEHDGTPGQATGDISSYELRGLGRGESRWLGTLDGSAPALADGHGSSRFDWMRLQGRAEAHPFLSWNRATPASPDFDRTAAAESGELGCNLVEANRKKGRDEARETGGQAGGSGNPPTTWDMDQESEMKAASTAAGKTDC